MSKKFDTKKYDSIIIGAGPAGMFAAFELINTNPEFNILVVEKGKEVEKRNCPMEKTGKCSNCQPCDIMSGVGGSGTFSDGTLNLRPDIGGNLSEFTEKESDAWDLVNSVDKVFLKFGAPEECYGMCDEENERLYYKAASADIKFIKIKQRHIGSDKTPELIKQFADYLKNKGVKFMSETNVKDLIIENNECRGIIFSQANGTEEKIYSKSILMAPGRAGMSWINEIVNKHNIDAKHGPIDIGVRVEVPAVVMNPITKINRDPKFHIWTSYCGDLIRTFCTNHQGFVVKENYGDFIGVNGHSLKDKKSENTNFAFLTSIELTHPLEDTSKYGESIAKITNTLGGGKPIIQRLGDLKKGRRSTFERLKRSGIKHSLEDVTPGDLAMALPSRIISNIIEGLEKLNKVIPGVATDSTFLYGAEIKFYSRKILVNKNMETSIKNLFVAGDGAGLSRDIVNAAATGLLAGKGIVKRIAQ